LHNEPNDFQIDECDGLGRTDPISGQALTSSELISNISLRNAIRQLVAYDEEEMLTDEE
jgi:hypothetical protein